MFHTAVRTLRRYNFTKETQVSPAHLRLPKLSSSTKSAPHSRGESFPYDKTLPGVHVTYLCASPHQLRNDMWLRWNHQITKDGSEVVERRIVV